MSCPIYWVEIQQASFIPVCTSHSAKNIQFTIFGYIQFNIHVFYNLCLYIINSERKVIFELFLRYLSQESVLSLYVLFDVFVYSYEGFIGVNPVTESDFHCVHSFRSVSLPCCEGLSLD